MRHKGLFLISTLLLILAVSASAGQRATTHVKTKLKAEPFLDAKTVIKVKKKTKVEILKRKGGWYQVTFKDKKKAEHRGWLKMASVRLKKTDEASNKKGSLGLKKTANLITTGRSGSKTVSASTGVRGLEEEDLSNAKPNTKALEKMEGFSQKESEVKDFADKLSLKSNKIKYFEKVKIKKIK